jgi:hypothetical protein
LNGGCEVAWVCDECYEEALDEARKALEERKKEHKH